MGYYPTSRPVNPNHNKHMPSTRTRIKAPDPEVVAELGKAFDRPRRFRPTNHHAVDYRTLHREDKALHYRLQRAVPPQLVDQREPL